MPKNNTSDTLIKNIIAVRSAILSVFENPEIKKFNLATERLRNQYAPIMEEMNKKFAAVTEVMKPYSKVLAQLAIADKYTEKLSNSGWLPHETTPFDLVENTANDLLSEAIEKYYINNWHDIKKVFESNIAGYDVDKETRLVLREAVDAHSHGMYRVAPRLIFPEIERVARIQLRQGMKRISSQERLQEAAGRLAPYQFKPGVLYGLKLYERLTNHLYVKVSGNNIDQYKASPVPNRHASLHGHITYSTIQTSLNMLIMADFVFQIIRPIKESMESIQVSA